MLTILLLLLLTSQCLVSHALRFRLPHDPRGPQPHPPAGDIDQRQELPVANGPGLGIDSIDSSLRDVAAVIPTTRTTLVTTPSLSPLTTRLPIPVSIPTTSVVVVPTATISDPAGGIPTYVFPSSTVQIPVATICPLNNLTTAITTVTGTGGSGSGSGSSSIGHSITPVPVSVSLPTPTFPPPNNLLNSSLVNLTAASEHNAHLRVFEVDPGVARVVFGNDSCQTVYTPTTTAGCRTSIRVPGSTAVGVSRCDQWVTFSTGWSGGGGCSSSSLRVSTAVRGGLGSSLVGHRRDGGVVSIPTTPAVVSVVPTTAVATDTGVVSGLSSTVVATAVNPIASVRDVLYYVAHWWDLASHDVPEIVRVEDCAVDQTGDACAVHTERWRVSDVVSTTRGTSMITYYGPVIFSSGTYTLSTSISISSLVTTTRTVTVPTIVRSVFPMTAAAVTGKGPTITVSLTMPTTRTWSLESLTVTTIVSKVTVTRTVVAETRSVV